MQQCPNCKKETKEMLVQKPGSDADSLDLVCLSCGAVKPTDNVESKFKEKSEVRSTNKEGKWDSDVQTEPKSIAAYGGTKMGTKDAAGKPINPRNWGKLRELDTRSDLSGLDHLKRDHNELFNELIRRIIPVQQKMLQEKTLLPLYLKCLELKVNKGRDTELIMIGIIHIYLKRENIPWKGDTTIWKHIFGQTGRTKKEILSITNVIMRALGWEIDKKGSTYGFHQKSYDEIIRIIKKIKEDDNSFLDLKISKRAYEIIGKVSSDGLTAGISPKNQAGAAIFLACKSEDLAISLDDIAGYCDSKKKNIMPHVKKFNSVLKYDLNF
jgi:transcription initiation factor TFIIIB Brf1 subunit/transcription initiation factor TFIIB